MASFLLKLVVGAIAVAVANYFYKSWQYKQLSASKGCLPAKKRYPHKEPFFGFDAFLEAGKMFSEHTFFPTTIARYRKHGPTFEMKILGVPTVCSIEPANIGAVFGSHDWGVGMRLEAFLPYCGKGFITTDGKDWEHSRTLFNNSFHRANIKDYHTYETYLTKMLKLLPSDGSTVDIQPLIFALYLDTATLWLFGESFESLDKGLTDETKEFMECFATSLGGGGLRIALGPMVFLHRDPKWHESNRKSHAFIDRYVDMALKRKEERQNEPSSEGKQRPVLLDLMTDTITDRLRLRNEALHAFIAAHETTACLISNIVFVLARHPEVFRKLRKEVLELGDVELTFDNTFRLKYLTNVINESLRLHPVFPYHARQANKDCILPTGGGPDGKSPIYMKKGWFAESNFAALHRAPEIWGDDAEEYKPERWETFKPAAWEYVPFGGGPRACAGQQKARMETSYFVARLMREFEDIQPRDEREWQAQVQVTAKNVHGCKVALTPARNK